jgi:hypothetical protein
MTMKTLAAILVLAAAAFVGGPAHAQLDPNYTSYTIYERGELVGEIYRDDISPDKYVEHWVLYPGYVYPSPENGLSAQIVPGGPEYRDHVDFLSRVHWAPGSRYVRVDCEDGTTLPGR